MTGLPPTFKAWGKHEFKGNLRKFKEGLKGKFQNTTKNAPERPPQVGGQLFRVRLPILNFKF